MAGPTQAAYRRRYLGGSTPWDTGRADFNLVEVVERTPILPCRALDVGCGTGHCAIWLAGRGFEVTGVDVSEVALGQAEANAASAGVRCTFLALDLLRSDVPGLPFGFALDRGCLHSYGSDRGRRTLAGRVAAQLRAEGFLLVIAGSADAPAGRPGPPRRSARDLVAAVEPFFEVLSLTASHFESNRADPPPAWACLLRRRAELPAPRRAVGAREGVPGDPSRACR